jgi:hypothetical protein
MLSKYPNCFIASELVDWLVSDGVCQDRRGAVVIAASLASERMITHVVDEEKPFADSYLFFRFRSPGVHATLVKQPSANNLTSSGNS